MSLLSTHDSDDKSNEIKTDDDMTSQNAFVVQIIARINENATRKKIEIYDRLLLHDSKHSSGERKISADIYLKDSNVFTCCKQKNDFRG